MTPEIMTAINRFDITLRIAVRRDLMAKQDDSWDARRLKRCEAWAQHKAARVELEAAIVAAIERVKT